ncbi:MAG: hypothetical protein H7Y88_11555 [Phycisphaerales bacterium]|nr:hypothetical protein [Phycisphaerales bacterium]
MRRVDRRLLTVVLMVVGVLSAMVATGCERQEPETVRESAAPSAGAQPRDIDEVRVVALSPAIAATMRDLGLGGLVVGRHGWDQWSDQSLPSCGDQGGVDYEALLRVRPTHVLLQWSGEVPRRLEEMASENTWELTNHPILSLEDIQKAARDLAAKFATADAAKVRVRASAGGALIERDDPWRLGRAIGVDGDTAGVIRRRVLLLVPGTAPAGLGPGSCHHELLEIVGGASVFGAGAGPYVELDGEDVLRLAPGAIVVFAPRAPGATGRSGSVGVEGYVELLGVIAKLDVPAVREGRVWVIDDPLGLVPSTSMLRVRDELARAMEAWLGGR